MQSSSGAKNFSECLYFSSGVTFLSNFGEFNLIMSYATIFKNARSLESTLKLCDIGMRT